VRILRGSEVGETTLEATDDAKSGAPPDASFLRWRQAASQPAPSQQPAKPATGSTSDDADIDVDIGADAIKEKPRKPEKSEKKPVVH
jgi:hypothetical protein